jgi:methylated-DNA-[protein]-cysteine S-methyltransferase
MSVPVHLDTELRRRAAAEGLLDVAYDFTDSPIGTLLLAATPVGLCKLSFDPEPERDLDELAETFGARVLRSPRPLDEVRRELDEYFRARRQVFELTLDLRPVPRFQRAVLEELARVPYGATSTYGALAAAVERPRAARAVGGAMNRNPIPIVLPCHRVVGADGRLVGYGGGLDRKRALLELEGVSLL